MLKDLRINPEFEKKRILDFFEKKFIQTGFHQASIAVSGGIDSATSLYLLREYFSSDQIFVSHLYYFDKTTDKFKAIINGLGIPEKNIMLSPIKNIVDTIATQRNIKNPSNETERIRLGNIMARVRMILHYDFSREHNALVVGTENRSEYHLGYFTRFGDEASDMEPLHHLYKTQVYQLARALRVPQEIIESRPSAGLWESQTDASELGFTYEEADPVLYLHFDEKKSRQEIQSLGYSKVKEIIDVASRNSFKHEVPYHL